MPRKADGLTARKVETIKTPGLFADGNGLYLHHSRLVETIVPSNPACQQTPEQATGYFSAAGGGAVGARDRAIAFIGQQVQAQTGYWAYIDVFFALMLISAAEIPLALILRRVKLH